MKLDSTLVVMQPDQSAFKGRVLVSCFSFDSDWETWEMHPAGDEIVCLLSGRASFEFEGRGHVGELGRPGEFLIVPRGTWHTAHTKVPTTLLFVTPGEGTRNAASCRGRSGRRGNGRGAPGSASARRARR